MDRTSDKIRYNEDNEEILEEPEGRKKDASVSDNWYDGTNQSIYNRMESLKKRQASLRSKIATAGSSSQRAVLATEHVKLETEYNELSRVVGSLNEHVIEDYYDSLPGLVLAENYQVKASKDGVFDPGENDGSALYYAAREMAREASQYDWNTFATAYAQKWARTQSKDRIASEMKMRTAAIDYAQEKTAMILDVAKRARIIDQFVTSAERGRRLGALQDPDRDTGDSANFLFSDDELEEMMGENEEEDAWIEEGGVYTCHGDDGTAWIADSDDGGSIVWEARDSDGNLLDRGFADSLGDAKDKASSALSKDEKIVEASKTARWEPLDSPDIHQQWQNWTNTGDPQSAVDLAYNVIGEGQIQGLPHEVIDNALGELFDHQTHQMLMGQGVNSINFRGASNRHLLQRPRSAAVPGHFTQVRDDYNNWMMDAIGGFTPGSGVELNEQGYLDQNFNGPDDLFERDYRERALKYQGPSQIYASKTANHNFQWNPSTKSFVHPNGSEVFQDEAGAWNAIGIGPSGGVVDLGYSNNPNTDPHDFMSQIEYGNTLNSNFDVYEGPSGTYASKTAGGYPAAQNIEAVGELYNQWSKGTGGSGINSFSAYMVEQDPVGKVHNIDYYRDALSYLGLDNEWESHPDYQVDEYDDEDDDLWY